MRRDDDLVFAQRSARILGESSGAALALKRFYEIEAAGFPSAVYLHQGYWLVQEPIGDLRTAEVVPPNKASETT